MTFSFKNNIRIFLDRKIGGVRRNVILVLSKDLTKEIPHPFRGFFQENFQFFSYSFLKYRCHLIVGLCYCLNTFCFILSKYLDRLYNYFMVISQQIEPAVLWCDSNPNCAPQLGRACCKLQQRLMLREMFLINLLLSLFSLMFRGIYNADKYLEINN